MEVPDKIIRNDGIWEGFSYSNAGAPIGIPIALASLDRAITHPSLLLKTTTGIPFSAGLKTLSQEA